MTAVIATLALVISILSMDEKKWSLLRDRLKRVNKWIQVLWMRVLGRHREPQFVPATAYFLRTYYVRDSESQTLLKSLRQDFLNWSVRKNKNSNFCLLEWNNFLMHLQHLDGYTPEEMDCQDFALPCKKRSYLSRWRQILRHRYGKERLQFCK